MHKNDSNADGNSTFFYNVTQCAASYSAS